MRMCQVCGGLVPYHRDGCAATQRDDRAVSSTTPTTGKPTYMTGQEGPDA